MQRAWIRFDRQALRDNVAVVKSAAPESQVMAVVKANAYGHGMIEVAQAIADQVDAYAVASLEEAIELRGHFPAKLIVCLSGLIAPQQLSTFEHHQISPVIYDATHVAWIQALDSLFQGDIWMKLNTGMNRAGIHPDFCADACGIVSANIEGRVRLMSHFSDADANANNGQRGATEKQITRFDRATNGLGYERSMANSAGLLAWPDAHYDWVRPGIMLYGSSPLIGQSAAQLGLKPVMSLEARLIKVDEVNESDSVGYGSTWTAEKQTCIGLVACGYGDGYPRHLVQQAHAVIGGKRVPIVGRVSMDSLSVDLSKVPDVEVGDVVQLWGNQLSADEVAQWAGTISYELFCKVTSRPERVFSKVNNRNSSSE